MSRNRRPLPSGFFVCLAGALLASSAALAADVAPSKALLDREMPRLLVKHKVPSVALAIIRDGRVETVAVYGEQSNGVPANLNTLYNVASLTKPVSAQIVLRLHASKQISIDAPMYPDWVDPDVKSDPRHEKLTARLALSHQTGFANWRRETQGTLKFRFEPGKAFGYSGEGYEYVARWVQAKTGQRLDAHAKRELFGPLGMQATSYTRAAWFDGRIARPSQGGVYHSPDIADAPVASDELYTTVSDYAKFLVGVMEGSGLDETTRALQMAIQVDQTATLCNRTHIDVCPDKAGFGLGWQVLHFGSKRFLMHTGSDRGEFTLTYWSPDTREGAVVLTNSNAGAKVIVDALDVLAFDGALLAYLKAAAR